MTDRETHDPGEGGAMKPYHGTPIGALSRNKDVLRGHNLVLTWTSYASKVKGERTSDPTQSAVAHACVAGSLLLDCGAFPYWQAQQRGHNPKPLDVPAVIEWYRKMIAIGRPTEVIIPDVIMGSECENDTLVRSFPHDLRDRAWPVWHTEDSVFRLIRLAWKFGRVCIGPMGAHSHVTGKAYTLRMVEAFNAITRDAPGTKLHALRGLQLAGGPFPFAQADSTDAGRNWSQTPHRLRTCLDRWDRRAKTTAKTWDFRMTTEAIYTQVRQKTIFDLPAVHRWSMDSLRTPS